MKERPILFSAPMIRALLDGRKTMTRRVVKPQPDEMFNPSSQVALESWTIGCPYGRPGDRLWVRETWFPCPVGKFCPNPTPIPKSLPEGWTVLFAADGDSVSSPLRWKPSIFMPRWASRITLELTSVRVERVQDISEDDAKAEGVIEQFRTVVLRPDGGPDYHIPNSYRGGFANLWDSLNAKRGFRWETNPWVWAISFKVIKPTTAPGDPDAIDRAM